MTDRAANILWKRHSFPFILRQLNLRSASSIQCGPRINVDNQSVWRHMKEAHVMTPFVEPGGSTVGSSLLTQGEPLCLCSTQWLTATQRVCLCLGIFSGGPAAQIPHPHEDKGIAGPRRPRPTSSEYDQRDSWTTFPTIPFTSLSFIKNLISCHWCIWALIWKKGQSVCSTPNSTSIFPWG